MGRFSAPSYLDTPGLRAFPPERRIAVYRQAHRKLLDGDPEYRRACLRYNLLVSGLCLGTAGLQVLGIFHLVSAALVTVVGVAAMVLVVVEAFRAQRYRNLRVGGELQKQENGEV